MTINTSLCSKSPEKYNNYFTWLLTIKGCFYPEKFCIISFDTKCNFILADSAINHISTRSWFRRLMNKDLDISEGVSDAIFRIRYSLLNILIFIKVFILLISIHMAIAYILQKILIAKNVNCCTFLCNTYHSHAFPAFGTMSYHFYQHGVLGWLWNV